MRTRAFLVKHKYIVLDVVVLLPSAAIIWCQAHNRALRMRFNAIEYGMPVEHVFASVGVPDWDAPCGATLGTGVPKNCVRELGYVEMPPIVPYTHIVSFDASGKVIDKATVVSP